MRKEIEMELYYGMGAIIGVCLLVLLMGTIKQKSAKIAVFIFRSAGGAVGICVINSILESQGIAVAAGINPVSILTIGTLGISGFALIYGILFYRFL
ncbi:pro-sigmaK processing inhibitor BofA family protein [Lachnospiraceae bacterium 66-29]